jgi:hypothetical protein
MPEKLVCQKINYAATDSFQDATEEYRRVHTESMIEQTLPHGALPIVETNVPKEFYGIDFETCANEDRESAW